MRRLAYVANEEGSVVGVAGYAYYENIERADPKYAFFVGVLAVCTGSSVLSCGLLVRHHENRAGWHRLVCQSKALQAG